MIDRYNGKLAKDSEGYWSKYKDCEKEITHLTDRLQASIKEAERLKCVEGYLSCGHLECFMTISEDGPHCSKCGRSYVSWEKLNNQITHLTQRLDSAFISAYKSGYQSGHHDTIENQFCLPDDDEIKEGHFKEWLKETEK